MSTYDVKFIQGWNKSFGYADETDITPAGLDHNELDYDPERYMSEDFFLREPREASITFFRTQFLLDHFVYPPDDEIINVVLYKDEDGNVIDEDEYDPETCTKDVVVNRYSKIIVKILEDERVVFLGLVQLSEVDDDYGEIKLQCVDFLDLIRSYSEALVYNVPGDDSYGYYFSKEILQNLIDMIIDTTGLELNYELADDIFMEWVDNYTVYMSPNLNHELINFTIPQYNNWVDYHTLTGVIRSTSMTERAVVFYQVFGFWLTSALGHIYRCSIKWIKYSPVNGWSDEQEKTYEAIEDIDTNGSYEILKKKANEWKLDWLSTIQSSMLFVIEPNDFYYVIDQPGSNSYLVKFNQTWWSAAIPYKSGQHKYVDLLKVVTLVNNLTIYQDEQGIFFSKRTDLPTQTEYDLMVEQVYKPFNQKDITRDEQEYDALDILWEDADGTENKKNREHVKEMYNEIFGSTYQKEWNTYISNPAGTITPGCRFRIIMDRFQQEFYIISSKKEGDWYKIVAYRTSIGATS